MNSRLQYRIGLWFTLAINVFVLGEYLIDNSNAKNIVLLFWMQSIFLAGQNVLMMIFATTGETVNENGRSFKTTWVSNFFMACFFLFHHGIFITAFGAIAVFSDKIPGQVFNAGWVYPTLLLLLVVTVLETPGKILAVRETKTNVMKLMFVPYIRLFPLALIFMGEQSIEFFWLFPAFLLLKLLVDLVYYRFMHIGRPSVA